MNLVVDPLAVNIIKRNKFHISLSVVNPIFDHLLSSELFP